MSSSTGTTQRIAFFAESNAGYYREELFRFTWHMGMNWKVKQRSVVSFHESIKEKYPRFEVLEASTKSTDYSLGMKLSAFNLMLDGVPVENVFQSSKQFNDGGPYADILQKTPIEAKRDLRVKTGKKYPTRRLTSFIYENKLFTTLPRSMFYDFIYIKALSQNQELYSKVGQYDTFTDIEFNQKSLYESKKGPFNCQARSLAIAVSLMRKGQVEKYLSNPEGFLDEIYPTKSHQMTLGL